MTSVTSSYKMSPNDIVRNHERIKKERKRDETFKRINEQAQSAPAWPEGRYSVIYADPPTEDDFGHTKKDVENHYPTMKLEDLMSLPVEEISHRRRGALPVVSAALWSTRCWRSCRRGASITARI